MKFIIRMLDQDDKPNKEDEKKQQESTVSENSMYWKFILIYRALDINSLVGNIGGYVGLFLGISILQAPDLLLNLFRFVSKSYKTSRRQRFNNIRNQPIVNGEGVLRPLSLLGELADHEITIQEESSC